MMIWRRDLVFKKPSIKLMTTGLQGEWLSHRDFSKKCVLNVTGGGTIFVNLLSCLDWNLKCHLVCVCHCVLILTSLLS